MAERIIRQLVDDIDGSELAAGKGESIEFAVRGVTYRIDLSSANVKKFEKALEPYVSSAARVGSARSRRNKSAADGKASSDQLAAIREWARKNKFEVSDRGRIKAEIVEAFNAAH